MGRQQGGGLRQYRRAGVEAAIKVEGLTEAGGPRRYRRAGVEASRKVEGQTDGVRPETIQESERRPRREA